MSLVHYRLVALFVCFGLVEAAWAAGPHRGRTHKEKKMTPASQASGEEKRLDEAMARLVPVSLTADVSSLSAGDRKALDKIIAAARYMDPLFLRQVWSGNVALEKTLEKDHSPLGRARLKWFRINAGPWSRLDHQAPFIAGAPEHKPPQAGFYPEWLTRAEFEAWVKTLPEAEKEKATGFFYVIEGNAKHQLKVVPYSEAYREFLAPAAKLLKEAASLTTNESLRKFLNLRADAFLSNDYYPSDVAWMDVNAPIEVTIGPYETYEDELFNYKAAFESFIALRDEAESTKLAKFSGQLQDIENNLPIDAKYRNPKLGAAAPIRVVDEVFTSGDARRGIATAAYNLPNDDKVIKEKGSKRVMLKNVQEAKFNKILLPIAGTLLTEADRKLVAFDPFFTHILMHELMHGLGPHEIKVGGKETAVRLALKELYAAIEEAKADMTGLWAMQYLIDKGVLDRQLEKTMYVTYLASMFRSVRFGVTEAHGKGTAMQFNYLSDRGAIHEDTAHGTFAVDQAKVKDAVRALTHDLLTLEAEGNYDEAKKMLDQYGVVRPEMAKALARLETIPVDIWPHFPLGDVSSPNL